MCALSHHAVVTRPTFKTKSDLLSSKQPEGAGRSRPEKLPFCFSARIFSATLSDQQDPLLTQFNITH